jgi:hypothetical protein
MFLSFAFSAIILTDICLYRNFHFASALPLFFPPLILLGTLPQPLALAEYRAVLLLGSDASPAPFVLRTGLPAQLHLLKRPDLPSLPLVLHGDGLDLGDPLCEIEQLLGGGAGRLGHDLLDLGLLLVRPLEVIQLRQQPLLRALLLVLRLLPPLGPLETLGLLLLFVVLLLLLLLLPLLLLLIILVLLVLLLLFVLLNEKLVPGLRLLVGRRRGELLLMVGHLGLVRIMALMLT